MNGDFAQTEFGHDWAGVDLAETRKRPALIDVVAGRAALFGSLACLSLAGLLGLMASLS